MRVTEFFDIRRYTRTFCGMEFFKVIDRGMGRVSYGITKEFHGKIHGVLLQFYQEGSELSKHRDLDGHNQAFWVLLKKPKEGGDLIVHGPHRSWGSRFKYFDGGQVSHEVTKIIKGSRISLMFQRGWYVNTPRRKS